MSGVFTQLSDDIAELVVDAGRGVVRVEARRRMPASGIVWSDDGVIVTAHHVVERDEDISVGLPDGGTAAAKLVGRDPSIDVAVLKAEQSGLTAVQRASADSVSAGNLVLALGRPGKDPRATLGMVNAVGDAWRTPAGGAVDSYVQTDVTMYPGFSGGPLVAPSGQVVGMNTSALIRGAAATIPVATLEKTVAQLLEHGRVLRGFLGVGAQPVGLQSSIADETGQDMGLLIASIVEDGPADKGGLLVGDTLVALDSEPLRGLDDLLGALGDKAGRTSTVRLVRAGQLKEISVVVGERP
ncbi:MAG: trypsin-like peptidase domain-containing protein [Chloroflexi bacterium]|nr:trypsin-like peptidase domain-containing protein [Chloroflexota bacterium]